MSDVVAMFPARLRKLREKAGLNKTQLAKAAMISAAFLGEIESGEKKPGIEVVLRLCGALNCRLDDLFPQ